MDLTVVEREEKIGLTRQLSGQNIPVRVSGIVIVGFVIPDARHKGCIGCKFLS